MWLETEFCSRCDDDWFLCQLHFCCTAIDEFEPSTKILFEIKFDIGNRVDNIITWLTN